MGAVGKIILILMVIVVVGAYSIDRGYLNVEYGIDIKDGGREAPVWGNSNFSEAALDPSQHGGEHVSLDLYTFNSIPVETVDGTEIMYEAYIGGKEDLANNPYDTGRRILFSYIGPEQLAGQCIHLEGRIMGAADVAIQEESTINLVYVAAESVTVIECS